jgi:hypothetical protein
MVTNRDTNLQTGSDDDDSDSYAILHGLGVRPDKPKPTRVYFYPLPNYAQDRRHDPRVRDSENSVMLPFSDGYLERFEATAEAGFYCVEMRAGREIIGSDVYEVKPKGQVVDKGRRERQPEPAAAAAAAVVAEPRSSSAQKINDTTDTIRATKELLREVAPPPPSQAAPLSREDVQGMIREAVRDAVSQTQAQKGEGLDSFAMVERVLELQKKLAPATQQKESGDEFERVMDLFDRVEQMRERIEPRGVDTEPSFLGKAASFIDTLGRNASTLAPLVAPMLPAQLQAMLAGTGAADPMPVTETQPQGEQGRAQPQGARVPQNEQEAFALMLHVIVSDLEKNKRAGRAADLIEELCVRFPSLAPAAQEICKAHPANALAMLAKYSGREDLPSFGHALGYVESLQNELRGDENDESDESDDAGESDAPVLVEMATARMS